MVDTEEVLGLANLMVGRHGSQWWIRPGVFRLQIKVRAETHQLSWKLFSYCPHHLFTPGAVPSTLPENEDSHTESRQTEPILQFRYFRARGKWREKPLLLQFYMGGGGHTYASGFALSFSCLTVPWNTEITFSWSRPVLLEIIYPNSVFPVKATI